MSERQVYMRVSLNEAHELWFCGQCGAVIVRDAWPTHDAWHGAQANAEAPKPAKPREHDEGRSS